MERLEKAFRSEKQFTSDVSHELKTPMAVILSECEYVLQENRKAEEYIESIETIQKQCRRTLSLIQQLLQISELSPRKMQWKKNTLIYRFLLKAQLMN